MGWAPRSESVALEQAYVAGMPHVRWCDFDSHGYAIVDVTVDELVFEWWAVATIAARSPGQRRVAAFAVRNGDPRVVLPR